MHSKMYQRILAIFLIITLTFANPLLITKSFAASIFDGTGDTGNKNVEFTASFKADDEESHTAICDVNSQDLAINLKVNVKDKGYVKNAKVAIVPEAGELNFALKGTAQEPEKELTQTAAEATEMNAEAVVSGGTVEEDLILPEETTTTTVTGVTTENDLIEDEIGTDSVVTQEQVTTIDVVDDVLGGNTEEVAQVSQESETTVQVPETQEQIPVVETPVVEDNTPIVVLNDMVESVEDNVISLKQIASKSEVLVNLPFKYVQEEYINPNKVNSNSKVVFTGVYVDEKGRETELYKEVLMNVSWTSNTALNLTSEITKYIPYTNGDKTGVILQTVVRLSNTTLANTLPVSNTKLTVGVPSLQGNKPNSMNLVANATRMTNGKSAELVMFTDDNWSYDEVNDLITITSKNEPQEVVINRNNGSFVDETIDEVRENRLYSLSGVDEYTLTYVYENVQIQDKLELNSVVSAEVETVGAENKATAQEDFAYNLTGPIGEIVSYSVENITDSYSKAYVYLNNNNSDKYEIKLDSREIINVSLKDIVKDMTITDTNAYYTTRDEKVATNDFRYNYVEISKDNFDQILGENGSLTIKDLSGNVVATINSESEVNDNGIININLSSLKLNRIQITTSAPVKDGDLIINVERCMTKSDLSKAEYTNVEAVTFETTLTSNYNYVGSTVENAKKYATTLARNTKTKINLALDRESLSTIALNEDVEIRVELNNDKDTSDIYGKSTFRIEMPNYIEKMDITNASIAYGEGLEIENIQAVDENGVVVIYVTLNGKQEYLNSGVTTNGTNIVINANIRVDVFAPATEQLLKATVENSEATGYENDGVATATVLYSAPSGVLTAEAISDYDDDNSMITSVHQGTIEDEIEIFDEAKTAKMDIIVMNNNNNTVSEVSILGRIPFKGVKDLQTGEDLGTTSDTTLAGGLLQSSSNKEQFNIYYSVNPEATKILDDPENEWVKDVTDYSKIKSFLIVPVDKDYEMQKAEVIKFSYEYIIPENLQHNESFYGTFMAYYVNNTDVAKIDEQSQADKVGLTTGEGPEISLELSSNKESVKEYEEIKYTAVVKNVGTSKSDATKVTIPVPKYTEYVSSSSDNDKVKINVDGNNAIYNVGTLEAGEKVELVLIVSALSLPIVDEETGTQVGTELEVKNTAVATANDLQKDLFSKETVVKVKKAELTVTLNTPIDQMGPETAGTDEEEEFVYYRSNPYMFYGQVENLDNKPISNLKATVKLPVGFNLDKAYRIAYDTDGITIIEVNDGVSYDESSRVVSFNFSEIEASRAGNFAMQISVGDLPEGKTKNTDSMVIEAKADNTDTYTSNEATITIGVPALEITQTTNTKNTYVKEGQTIEYVFNVKNVGCAIATGVTLTDKIPEGLKVQGAVYTIAGNKGQITSLNGKDIIINASIRPGEELNATVKAMASNLNGIQEKSVTNAGEVKADHITSSTTNSITHIVEADEENSVVDDEDTSEAVGTSRLEGSIAAKKSTEKRSESNVVKTYRITGNVWLDANRNGMRDSGEQPMKSDVSLVNVDTGSIVKKGSTTSSGDYTFTGVENGKYTVIFDYDTTLYTATLFKQDGVAQDVNSDAVTTQIEQDGRIRNAAITDTIEVNDLSISNIDLGLVNAQKFDLSVDKVITKITSQSNNATNTLNFENGSKLTQMPIAGKYVASTVVYIEYVITVKNEGDIAGNARKIVDYIPSGMQLNSSLSPDWYSGNDGNLYSSSLADVELQPGEARQLKLVLTRQMTVDNTDIVSNQAEIAEDYNIYGVSDINSTPMNKVQKENDLSKADAILTIRTGETLIYTSVIITSIILGAIIIAIAYAKIVIPKRKRGV